MQEYFIFGNPSFVVHFTLHQTGVLFLLPGQAMLDSTSLFFIYKVKKREYMIIINATKRRGGKTCVIGPPLLKLLTIIDQIRLGEI